MNTIILFIVELHRGPFIILDAFWLVLVNVYQFYLIIGGAADIRAFWFGIEAVLWDVVTFLELIWFDWKLRHFQIVIKRFPIYFISRFQWIWVFYLNCFKTLITIFILFFLLNYLLMNWYYCQISQEAKFWNVISRFFSYDDNEDE